VRLHRLTKLKIQEDPELVEVALLRFDNLTLKTLRSTAGRLIATQFFNFSHEFSRTHTKGFQFVKIDVNFPPNAGQDVATSCAAGRKKLCSSVFFSRRMRDKLWLNQKLRSPHPVAKKIMTEKKYTWNKIADHLNELAFAANHIAVAELKGKKICIGQYQGMTFAFAYTCPHAGGFLADGYIDALGNVVCPLHQYKYSMQNGRNVSGEGYYLKHWPVELREDGVFVGMPARAGSDGEETGNSWNIFR